MPGTLETFSFNERPSPFAFQDLGDIDELQEEDSDGEEDDGHDEL